MNTRFSVRAVVLCLCFTLGFSATPAGAGSLPTKSDIVWIAVAIGAIGAGIGIGVYFAIHHSHSIRGCAISDPTGLELQTEGDQQTFQLMGITSDVKAGDRVKVVGKKKGNGSGNRSFLVEKLAKDYGACHVLPARP